MTIVALAPKGHEFVYSARSAHAVSKAKANKIVNILNDKQFNIHEDNVVWFIYEVDKYDTAYEYASDQKFTYYKGVLKRKYTFNWLSKSGF